MLHSYFVDQEPWALFVQPMFSCGKVIRVALQKLQVFSPRSSISGRRMPSSFYCIVVCFLLIGFCFSCWNRTYFFVGIMAISSIQFWIMHLNMKLEKFELQKYKRNMQYHLYFHFYMLWIYLQHHIWLKSWTNWNAK